MEEQNSSALLDTESNEEGRISETRTPPARTIIYDDSDLTENDLPFPPPNMIDSPDRSHHLSDAAGIEMTTTTNLSGMPFAPNTPAQKTQDEANDIEENKHKMNPSSMIAPFTRRQPKMTHCSPSKSRTS